MSFIWPVALVGLAAMPLLVAASLARSRRRASRPTTSLGSGPTSGNRPRAGRSRDVLVLLALTSLLVGFARPRATIDVPHRQGTVILAFDTSSSMMADDLDPTRLDAAKMAATAFVNEQPGDVKIGVVSFGDGGVVTLRPSDDRVAALASIDRLQAAGGTSLSQGLFASLSALADGPIIFDPDVPAAESPEVDFGGFGSAIIIMFSDGEDTSEQDPAILTELAASAGIRVFPVGIGSAEGAVIDVDGFSVGTALDEAALQDLAARTNGTYFRAEEASDLGAITDSLEREFTVEPEDLELTAFFALGALLLATAAAAIRMRSTGRMP